MSFLKSAVNQVGRDLGKVVSNSIFEDSHSSPYRKVGIIRETTARSTQFKTEFDKAINFQLGHRPITLIHKISGAYSVIKNEANYFLSDGYLDTTESELLFKMMSQFNSKVDDICDLLEIDEYANEKEINQLAKIVEKTNDLFKESLQLAAKGCQFRKMEHLEEVEKTPPLIFYKYVGLHVIWMGKYARGHKKSLLNTIVANIADFLFFVSIFTRPYLFFQGINNFFKEKKRRKIVENAHLKLADLEEKRGLSYLRI